jgi:hypothetical protein
MCDLSSAMSVLAVYAAVSSVMIKGAIKGALVVMGKDLHTSLSSLPWLLSLLPTQ